MEAGPATAGRFCELCQAKRKPGVGLQRLQPALDRPFPLRPAQGRQQPPRPARCTLGQVAQALQTLAVPIQFVGRQAALDAAVAVGIVLRQELDADCARLVVLDHHRAQVVGVLRIQDDDLSAGQRLGLLQLGQHLGAEGVESRAGRAGPLRVQATPPLQILARG